MIEFRPISTWDPDFVAAIRRHYTGSRGAPPGRKLAWEIWEDGVRRGWYGLGEPPFKCAPRRRLGLEDARPAPVCDFIFRLEVRGPTRASSLLRQLELVAGDAWLARYGWRPVHWESLVQPDAVASSVAGACYRRAGYRSLGRTTGRTARRPAGATHAARIWTDGAAKVLLYRGPLARVPDTRTRAEKDAPAPRSGPAGRRADRARGPRSGPENPGGAGRV